MVEPEHPGRASESQISEKGTCEEVGSMEGVMVGHRKYYWGSISQTFHHCDIYPRESISRRKDLFWLRVLETHGQLAPFLYLL
jgi:hypothetical protein